MGALDTAVSAFLILCGLIGAGISLYLKRYIAWLITIIPWGVLAAYGITNSTAAWDGMFFVFWMSLAVVLVCLIMSFQTKSMEAEELSEDTPQKDDVDNYSDEMEEYSEKQSKISKATARRSRSRR